MTGVYIILGIFLCSLYFLVCYLTHEPQHHAKKEEETDEEVLNKWLAEQIKK